MQGKSWAGEHDFDRHVATVLDPKRVLEEIGLQEGDTLLDVGSGEGRFAIPAAEMVGDRGTVYAFDTSEERLTALKGAITQRDLTNIEAFVDDVTKHISLGANLIDVCLMANVFHELVEQGTVEDGLREIRRMLRSDGVLAVLDFRKDVEGSHGPPPSVRLSPREVEELVGNCGFKKKHSTEVGLYHYLVLFGLAL